MASDPWPRWRFGIVILIAQLALIILFGIFTTYERSALPSQTDGVKPDTGLHPSYAMFQDVHIMIFVGFGFLMTFLKKYGYGAVGINFLLAAFSLQWAIIIQGLFSHHGGTFAIGIKQLLEGDIAAAAVLITFGAMLGKLSPFQLMIVAVIEIVFFSLNFHIGMELLGAVDAGGSMFIHTFGAYFGLACAWVMNKKWHKKHHLAGSVYHSDVFALVGTIFLWICWPSFNAALVPDSQQYRAVVNTYLALATCVLVSFGMSVIVSTRAKLDIVHIQNATLAGGVAVGTAADFIIHPFGAMMIGGLAGALSVVGYQYFTPALAKIGIHDTCGVNNLHGMPGIFAGLAGIVAAAMANQHLYGQDYHAVFPRTAPMIIQGNKTGEEIVIPGRSSGDQAVMQAAALGITLALAVVGGAVTGLCLKWKAFIHLKEDAAYDDCEFWELPEKQEEQQEMLPTDQQMSNGVAHTQEKPLVVRSDFNPTQDFEEQAEKQRERVWNREHDAHMAPQHDDAKSNPAHKHDLFQ